MKYLFLIPVLTIVGAVVACLMGLDRLFFGLIVSGILMWIIMDNDNTNKGNNANQSPKNTLR